MKKILFSVIVILCGISLMAQNSAVLKLNLEKDKKYLFSSFSDQTVTQTVNGNQQTVDSRVDYSLSLKMIDVTPEFMITEVHFDTLITKTNSMGKVTNFSSTVEGNIKSSEMADVISCIMNRLSKNAIYVKMDFTGKPIEVVNAKMISDLVLKDTSSITLTGPTAAAVKTQLANTVSEENIKTMLGAFTWYLPGRQIAAGENWDLNQQVNSGGMLLDIKTTFHLDKLSGNLANVSSESHIKATENAVPIKSAGATVTYDNLQGMSRSNISIDILTGLIVENKGETHISGSLGISGPGFSMDMPMDINGRTEVKALQ